MHALARFADAVREVVGRADRRITHVAPPRAELFISLRKYKTIMISKYFLLDLQINTKRMLTRSGNDVKKKEPIYNNAMLASESISR